MKRVGRMSPTTPVALGLALALVSATPAVAQRMPPMRGRPPGQQGRVELEQRIRARFGQMIQQRLGLDDASAKALDATVQSFQADRARLAREEEALRKRTEAFALDGSGADTEARQLLDRMKQLRAEESHLFQTEQDSLSKVLTPSQLLRFNVLREQLAQRIQRLRMGGMMGRGRGPGRGDAMRGGGGGPGGAGAGGRDPGGFSGDPLGWDPPPGS